MPYAHLDWRRADGEHHQQVFHHADMYLHDAYGMFRGLPPAGNDGGAGQFSIVLVLLCVLDGLATWIWPTSAAVDDHQQRFKQLVRNRLHWGPEGKRRWLDKGNAADQLYTEFRNPLVHELAHDKASRSRPAGYLEPIVGKWGRIPERLHDIAAIDALESWNDNWPILCSDDNRTDGPRNKLCAAALYWAVKRLAQDLVAGKS